MKLSMQTMAATLAKMAYTANEILSHGGGQVRAWGWYEISDGNRQDFIRLVKIVIQNPRITPAGYHAAWVNMKKQRGWKYGPKEGGIDELHNVTHPCLVSYHELPEDQKVKNAMVIAIVTAWDWDNEGIS